MVCLIYLRAHDFRDRKEAYVKRQNHSPVGYATSCWSEHFHHAGNNPIIVQLVLDSFIRPESHSVDWPGIDTYLSFPYFLHIKVPTGDLLNRTIRLNTLLYYSIPVSNLDLIASIIREGADMDRDDGACGSMMAAAAMKGDLKTVEYLID